MKKPRLDVLLYSHDGRGLGHASRSIGIGLALRRLYPQLKVLFISGCSFSQELIGRAPLDWLKLPSYKTQVVDGKSGGVAGNSMFSDQELGELRAEEIAHVIRLYRPRVVLVDHTPQGKHRELVDAINESRELGRRDGMHTHWILGVRGVVGDVPQAKSAIAAELFKKCYDDLLWYGDAAVLGTKHSSLLQKLYGKAPVECGYVLRLAEYCFYNALSAVTKKKYAGTVSIPWLGEHSKDFLVCLAGAIKALGPARGRWRIFVDMGDESEDSELLRQLLESIPHCEVEPPSGKYISALMDSKTVIIYGGYNSVMDVLHVGIPAVVVLRQMQDDEQLIHLQSLQKVVRGSLSLVSETDISAGRLQNLLVENLEKNVEPHRLINLGGAETAARYIRDFLG